MTANLFRHVVYVYTNIDRYYYKHDQEFETILEVKLFQN